jgi:putative aldouronate transport system permease protein
MAGFLGESRGRRIFLRGNYLFLTLIALLSLFPLVYVLAVSFSSGSAATFVTLWPKGFTTSAYQYVLDSKQFIDSFLVSLERVVLGVSVNMVLTVLVAYPLSKTQAAFRWRTVYAWFFVFTMLFGGGLIPLYMVVRSTHLIDSIWSLVLPTAVPVFNVILLLNFFRGIPQELEEAAFIDGAGHWATLWRVYLPLSKPALATVLLFAFVFHWNSWFDGIIYMNTPSHYPLQSYLETLVVGQGNTVTFTPGQFEESRLITDQTVKAAQIFIATIPIILVYPFLQRYFTKGIVLGSVKE